MSDGLFSLSESCGCRKWYCKICNPDPVEQAMEAALDMAADWRAQADLWLASQPSGRRFTSEDVTEACGFPAGEQAMHRNNAVGAWIRKMSKRDLITRLDPVPSRNNKSHGATIWLWMKN